MKGERGAPELTLEQEAVVSSIVAGKNVVARAGAGSGKTLTLVEAYASLVSGMKDAANPFERILAITFTNEAAYNLKKSLFRRCDNDVRALLTDSISTIHSFCNAILASHLVELSINPAYEIADENSIMEEAHESIDGIVSDHFGTDSELREVISAYGYDGNGGSCFRQALLRIYASARVRGMTARELETSLADGRKKLSDFSASAAHGGDAGISSAGEALDFASRVAHVLGRYLVLFWNEFEKRKRTKGTLSFDDVLYYTYILLKEHPDIREHYREKYSYIMVDEFQDTDRLQYEIISMISAGERCAFVGDLRQSIYEWRNADPSIMEAVEREILRLGTGGVLQLSDNYRSTPELISFFNTIFPAVFGDDAGGYTPMRHANKAMYDGTDPAVRIILPGGADISERRANEASLICDEVKRLVSSGTAVYDKEKKNYRSICLRDIAILFRSRSPIWTYERKLREHGIPYIHVQSESFFEKREVMDMLNYMSHLAQPSDNFYTFSALRSPIFGCSDDLLLRLSVNRFDLAMTLAETGGEDRRKLQLFVSLDEQSARGRNGFTHRLLSDVIARTRLDLVYLSSKEGKQAYANILKLLDMVRGMEKDQPAGLLEIVRRLRRRAEEGRGEPEYPMNDEKSNAVRIMTVHASKGLEFPVVFVADSSRGGQAERRETFYDEELGIVPGVPRRSTGPVRECIERMNRNASARRSAQAEKEDRRIFYVSLTRAQQFLYISSFRTERKNDRSWNCLLSPLLPQYDGREINLLPSGLRLKFIREAASAPAPIAAAVDGRQEIKFRMHSERAPEPALRVNVTDMADFMVCPYRKKLSSTVTSPAQAGEAPDAKERGGAVHEVLESYDYRRNAAPSNAGLIFGKTSDAIETAIRFTTSSYGREAAAAENAGTLRRESMFMLRHGVHTIKGKVDLWAGAGEEALVVDYKTGDTAPHRQEYKNQLMLYAMALRRLRPFRRFRLVCFSLDAPERTWEIAAGEEALNSFEQELDAALTEMAEGRIRPMPSEVSCSGCSRSRACEFAFSGVRGTFLR